MERMKNLHNHYSSELSHQEILFKAESIISCFPTIGIIGGLGPDATADLMREINDNTRLMLDAQKDQDHLRILVASNAPTPDRTSHINAYIGKSDKAAEDPFFHLVSSYLDLKGQQNQKQRVKYVGIPCNTAHFYVDALQKFMDEDESGMKIVHMIESVAKKLRSDHSDIHTVGLLATSGTIDTGLYQNVLEENGLKVVIPDSDDQVELVMKGIYDEKEGVKAGVIEEPRRKFVKASSGLKEKGAQAIIEGCTEIPLALSQKDVEDMLVINPTNILARRLIELTTASL